jgi:protein-tyrosine phosphatase
MIDLRCHILDGTPCGPDSFSESLAMCRVAIADGVRTMVATPRWEAGRAEPPLAFEKCRRKLERLEAETRGVLSLKLGFAFQFSTELPGLVNRYGSKLALAGKQHLLISLPSVGMPLEVEDVWKALARAGFSILDAHPECNTVLRREPARLARWVSEGVRLQVDTASVAGTHGREVRRFALECLRQYEGRIVIASNVRQGANKNSSLGKVFEELTGSIGARQARSFMKETPAALIGDGVAHINTRKSSSRSLTSRGPISLFRSIRPIKSLIGEPDTNGK